MPAAAFKKLSDRPAAWHVATSSGTAPTYQYAFSPQGESSSDVQYTLDSKQRQELRRQQEIVHTAREVKRLEQKQADQSVVMDAEAIVDEKRKDGVMLYRVNWTGYSSADDTWEPLAHVEQLINAWTKQKAATSSKRCKH